MRFQVKDRDNPFVRTVANLAADSKIMDSELGFAHWSVATRFLYPYTPSYLVGSLDDCYKLAQEFEWRHESIISTFHLDNLINPSPGYSVTVREAFVRMSPTLVDALTLPRKRTYWEFTACSLVYACSEVSGQPVGQVAALLCSLYLDSNRGLFPKNVR